jgi:hypothetical protein
MAHFAMNGATNESHDQGDQKPNDRHTDRELDEPPTNGESEQNSPVSETQSKIRF